jgi:hypothetical protein
MTMRRRAGRYRELGAALGISDGHLDALDANCPPIEAKFEEVPDPELAVILWARFYL